MQPDGPIERTHKRARVFADVFDLHTGHVEVVGGRRSGKTTLLVEIANACAEVAPTVWFIEHHGQIPVELSPKVTICHDATKYRLRRPRFVIIDDADCFSLVDGSTVEELWQDRIAVWVGGTIITSRNSDADAVYALASA